MPPESTINSKTILWWIIGALWSLLLLLTGSQVNDLKGRVQASELKIQSIQDLSVGASAVDVAQREKIAKDLSDYQLRQTEAITTLQQKAEEVNRRTTSIEQKVNSMDEKLNRLLNIQTRIIRQATDGTTP